MVKTASFMTPLGTEAPDFNLVDVRTNQDIQFKSNEPYKGSVVMFICNHCPFVKHINTELVKVANNYISNGIRFFAINSNDIINYPDDSPLNMKKVAEEYNYPFPYLFDETQEVAKTYKAACTPDFFVFDNANKLVYRGQFDDSRPGNNLPVTGESLANALDSLVNGVPLTAEQKPSIGCNIKWKE